MTRKLQLDPAMQQAIGTAVLVSGSARSGTTVLGKLIHSFSDVEYVFEPPTVIALFALLDTLPESTWRFMYETYLAEDFLANALAGRSINTNRADDSSIWAVKSEQEIERRLGRSRSKFEVMQEAVRSVLAYKVPNIVPLLGKFHLRYPDTRLVVIKRGAIETIHSLIRKGWFQERGGAQNLIWPFRLYDGVRIPYWVAVGDEELWRSLGEIDRCAYYYVRMSDAPPEGERVFHVLYTSLVNQPAKTANQLAEWLGLKFGDKTPNVLATIKATGKQIDISILDRVTPALRDKVMFYSALSE